MQSKPRYRIQGTLTEEERQLYLDLKEKFEKENLKGTNLTDGQFIMTAVKSLMTSNDQK